MNCDQLRELLDAYMDGELSDVQLREMEAHAAACEDCRRELAAAKLVRDALGALPGEVAVPLKAQAGWRNAVRAEAKRRGARRWLRAACAAAAALVLVLGATALLGRMPQPGAREPLTAAAPRMAEALPGAGAAPTQAVVAVDGETGGAQASEEAYAAWKKYAAEDLDSACATVEALAEEYGGTWSAERFEEAERPGAGSAIYRIELPRDFLPDFLSAASHLGAEQDSETRDCAGDTALVYIQIDETIVEE